MLCFFKNGRFFLGVFKGEVLCKIFLLLKPQTGQSDLVRGKQNAAESLTLYSGLSALSLPRRSALMKYGEVSGESCAIS